MNPSLIVSPKRGLDWDTEFCLIYFQQYFLQLNLRYEYNVPCSSHNPRPSPHLSYSLFSLSLYLSIYLSIYLSLSPSPSLFMSVLDKCFIAFPSPFILSSLYVSLLSSFCWWLPLYVGIYWMFNCSPITYILIEEQKTKQNLVSLLSHLMLKFPLGVNLDNFYVDVCLIYDCCPIIVSIEFSLVSKFSPS